MKLKFDANLEFQLEAIGSVTGMFSGFPLKDESAFSLGTDTVGLGLEQNELGVGNSKLPFGEELVKNLQSIQIKHNVPKSLDILTGGIYPFPNFSIEMETGTGKTYVYLRTIFELKKLYGFKKFIIVVPSVAIREGVLNSINTLKDHLRGLYENAPFDYFIYNSKDLSRVRQFAVNNEIQIMIINIQAFQKDAGEDVDYFSLSDDQRKRLNVIHQEQDKMSGRRPIEYVQATNPILIIDEPQSVDNTPKSQKAIKNLNPLFCLRYSATHLNPYNLLYQLDPIKAYDMRLVKQIEVVDMAGTEDPNQTFVRLDSIFYPKNSKTPQAKVTIFEDTPNGTKEKQVKVKHGSDLSAQTNRKDYDGYLVTNINAEEGNQYVEFQNGVIVEVYKESGGMGEERMEAQIYQAVEAHFAKEKKLKGKGIKVLSLFFIDHVKNYRTYDDDGNSQKGPLALYFEKAYEEISHKQIYKGLLSYKADEVHDGYFSADKKKGRVVELLDTSGNTAKDDETYELIMKDKERLLSLDVPLRFIFSHSALKEGWDNPNVFQICTLREMGTDRERRQTIGRGLRLPVNQDGERVYDEQINRLTVIANETFENFARGLQQDIEEAIDPTGGFKFGRLPETTFSTLLNAEGTQLLTQEESKEIWEAVKGQGMIEPSGDFTEKFRPDKAGFSMVLPDKFEPLKEPIISQMKKYVPREFVKNARERQKVTYNKRIEDLNEDFKALWEKISRKTRYSVEFKTEQLIEKAVSKIKSMAEVKPVKLEITKRDMDIKESGLEGGKITASRTHTVTNRQPLPDILTFLQRETELTRGTLVQILKKSDRLKEFTINPQAFMTAVAKLIGRALHELIIDGIKYEPIQGQCYEMRLFEQQEVEEYLNRLYEIKSSDNRTPYDFIACDSEKEREIAVLLDSDERVKFFCKLPRWFRVATPLGDYNPDWAVVVEDSHKLYLVRETKSTLERDKRRETENKKVDCGKAHFTALGVNFKDATTINEVLEE